VYIERAGQSASYPVLARVLVSYNGRVGYDASLAKALEDVFGAGAGNAILQGGQPAPAAPGAVAPAPSVATADQAAAASQISSAIGKLKSAQQSGDFAAQGQALQELDQAVQRYQTVQPSGAPAPAPAPAPTPGG
jgi:hypothetical protein